MGYCSICGRNIDGEGLCATCSAPAPTYTAPTYTAQDITSDDFPCQRCGMYLPKTELQMWNSRLYCNYCIMDLKDEEQRMRKQVEAPTQPVLQTGRDALPQHTGRERCERCGRQVGMLYSRHGRKLCVTCATEEDGTPPSGNDALGIAVRAIRGFGEKIGLVKKESGGSGEQNAGLGKGGSEDKKGGGFGRDAIKSGANGAERKAGRSGGWLDFWKRAGSEDGSSGAGGSRNEGGQKGGSGGGSGGNVNGSGREAQEGRSRKFSIRLRRFMGKDKQK